MQDTSFTLAYLLSVISGGRVMKAVVDAYGI